MQKISLFLPDAHSVATCSNLDGFSFNRPYSEKSRILKSHLNSAADFRATVPNFRKFDRTGCREIIDRNFTTLRARCFIIRTTTVEAVGVRFF